jgi:hypothetical protein
MWTEAELVVGDCRLGDLTCCGLGRIVMKTSQALFQP